MIPKEVVERKTMIVRLLKEMIFNIDLSKNLWSKNETYSQLIPLSDDTAKKFETKKLEDH